ncbi:MAG TPA: N-acetyltransferase, partial [Verrucomicrobiae bacterium]
AGDSPPAFLSYTREGGRVVLDHTFVPEELRGRGTAAALARAALARLSQMWRAKRGFPGEPEV